MHTTWTYASFAGLPHLFAEYECNEGYALSGSARYMYCREERWLGSKPECRRGEFTFS